MRQHLVFWFVLFFIALACFACARQEPLPATSPQQQIQTAQTEAPHITSSHFNIGFASREKYIEHYHKHGQEFGSITKEKYLELAQELRDTSAGGDILEYIRNDGVATRYDRTSGAFIAFNANYTIRTFFRPNDGERYFHRQRQRENND